MESSTWALILATWACDDEGTPEQSVECRKVASVFIMKFRHTFSAPEDVFTAITVDFLRRAGKFDEASALISDKEASVQEELFQKILRFPAVLIEERDMERHAMEEAVQSPRSLTVSQQEP